jgi:hypothetical protein
MIFRQGRKFRVHVLLATQGLYAKTTPGDVLGDFLARGLTVSFGRPADMTIEKAYPQQLQKKARLIGECITEKGRGIIGDPEKDEVREVQAYFGYHPGMDINSPKIPIYTRPQLREWRDKVSNRIPNLYRRTTQ